jgi:hypothetical protein
LERKFAAFGSAKSKFYASSFFPKSFSKIIHTRFLLLGSDVKRGVYRGARRRSGFKRNENFGGERRNARAAAVSRARAETGTRARLRQKLDGKIFASPNGAVETFVLLVWKCRN